MSGNIRGQINCRMNPGTNWKVNQEHFVSLTKFLAYLSNNDAGPIELIASYSGSTGNTSGYTDPGSVGGKLVTAAAVHAAYGSDNVATNTSGLATWVRTRRIQVIFSIGWDGGNVVVEGTDEAGNFQTETYLSPGGGGGTQTSALNWTTVTSITNTAAGAGLTITFTVQYLTLASFMNYWDESYAAGEGAFVVYRWKKFGESGTTTARTHSWYLLLQWNRGGDQGGSGYSAGAPVVYTGPDVGVGPAYSEVGIATAIGMDGGGSDSNPWAGTVGRFGEDTKGTPVWVKATGLAVFPRVNGTGGSGATNKQWLCTIDWRSDGDSTALRANFFADDDHFVGYHDCNSTGNWGRFIVGPYTPVTGLTVGIPHVMLCNDPTAPGRFSGGYGDPGGGGRNNGGILPADFTYGCRSVYKENTYDVWMAAEHQPSREFSPTSLVTLPMALDAYEAGVIGGYLGDLNTPLMREINYCDTYDQTADFMRVVFGWNGTASDVKYIAPWDGATVVNATPDRDGVQFSRAP